MDLEYQISYILDECMEVCYNPLYNPLEVGFRHSELSPKEKIERYEDAIRVIRSNIDRLRELLSHESLQSLSSVSES